MLNKSLAPLNPSREKNSRKDGIQLNFRDNLEWKRKWGRITREEKILAGERGGHTGKPGKLRKIKALSTREVKTLKHREKKSREMLGPLAYFSSPLGKNSRGYQQGSVDSLQCTVIERLGWGYSHRGNNCM